MQIEQWTETRYPSFIQIGQPVPTSSDEWTPGRDARIRQLPGPSAEVLEKRARLEQLKRQEGKSLGKDDVSLSLTRSLALCLSGSLGARIPASSFSSVQLLLMWGELAEDRDSPLTRDAMLTRLRHAASPQFVFLAMVIGGMLGIATIVLLITGGGVWWFYLRDGAWYGVRLSPPPPRPCGARELTQRSRTRAEGGDGAGEQGRDSAGHQGGEERVVSGAARSASVDGGGERRLSSVRPAELLGCATFPLRCNTCSAVTVGLWELCPYVPG